MRRRADKFRRPPNQLKNGMERSTGSVLSSVVVNACIESREKVNGRSSRGNKLGSRHDHERDESKLVSTVMSVVCPWGSS